MDSEPCPAKTFFRLTGDGRKQEKNVYIVFTSQTVKKGEIYNVKISIFYPLSKYLLFFFLSSLAWYSTKFLVKFLGL